MANLYQGNYYNNLNKVNAYNILIQNPNIYSPQLKQQYINNQASTPFLLEQQNIGFNSPAQNVYSINTIRMNPNLNQNINQNIYQTTTSDFNYKEESRVPRFYYKQPTQNIIIPNNYFNNAQVIKFQRSNTDNFAPRMTTVPRLRQNYYYNVLNNNVQPVEVKIVTNNIRYNSLNQNNNNRMNYNINNNIRIISNEQIINNDTQSNNPQNNTTQIKGIQSIKSIKTKKGKKKSKKIPKVTKVTKLTNENISENNGKIISEKIEKQISNNNNLLSSNEQINDRNRFAFSAHFPSSIKLKNNNIMETNNQMTKNSQSNLQNGQITPFITLNGEILNNSNCKEYYRQTNTAPVTSYGYSQNQNAPNRNYMEDEGRVVENFNGDPNKILFCIFDGHGGGQVSKFLQENFYKYMKNIVNYKNYNNGFIEIFRKVDQDIKTLNCPNVGSTATIVYIEKQKETNKRILYCANVGDSRCVLVSKTGCYRLSYDDRVKDPIENDRINKHGGIIVNNRVYGQLMLSRSFGDWKIKDVGVIVDPHFTRFELDEDALFCVIASDGVWDVLKDEECSALENMYCNTRDMSKNIIKECMKRGSLDNLSCFVISLK